MISTNVELFIIIYCNLCIHLDRLWLPIVKSKLPEDYPKSKVQKYTFHIDSIRYLSSFGSPRALQTMLHFNQINDLLLADGDFHNILWICGCLR